MSQKDERDLKEAVDRAALEWNRLDATLYSDLPQGQKLAVLSHLRKTNSKTGVQWASASYHAKAIGVSTKQAERIMRALRDEGVLEEVTRKEGGVVTVKLKTSWIEETERQFIEWRSKRPRTPRAGVTEPRPPTCPPPAAHVPTPRPPTCPYPFIDPPISTDEEGKPSFQPKDVLADISKPNVASGSGLQMQGETAIAPPTDKKAKGEVEGFNGQTWVWVDRLAKLDAIGGAGRYAIRSRIAAVSAATSPDAVRAAIEDLEQAAQERHLEGSAMRALLGFARRAIARPRASQAPQWASYKGGAYQP